MSDLVDKEKIESSESSSHEEEPMSIEDGENGEVDVEATLSLVAEMKDTGNTLFKGGQVEDALSSYEGAIDAIKGLPEKEQTDNEKVKPVLVALHGNVCMCRVKSQDWEGSISSADEVIKRDSNNVKALYRRGLAKMKVNRLDGARSDLNAALRIDPNNAPAKKELATVEKVLKEKEKKDAANMKKALAGNMFGTGKGGFYDDREKERAAKKRREEDEENRLRDNWTKSKLERRTKGLEEQTFEEYKKDLKEEKELQQKEAEEREEEAKKKASESASTSKTTTSSPPKVSPAKKTVKNEEKEEADSDDEDDEDLKGLIKGYKKRSDGSKTSYFNNEMDEQTKNLIGDSTPKALGDPSSVDNFMPQALPATGSGSAAPSTAPSAWNHAGTFESRDMTSWAKIRLEEHLKQATYLLPSDPAGDPPSLFGPVEVTTKEVKDVKGDAEIVISRGKKKAIYDMSATVSFEAVMDTSSATVTEKTFKGSIKFSDITGDDEPEYLYSLKKSPAPEYKARLDQAIKGLVDACKASCGAFKNQILEQ